MRKWNQLHDEWRKERESESERDPTRKFNWSCGGKHRHMKNGKMKWNFYIIGKNWWMANVRYKCGCDSCACLNMKLNFMLSCFGFFVDVLFCLFFFFLFSWFLTKSTYISYIKWHSWNSKEQKCHFSPSPLFFGPLSIPIFFSSIIAFIVVWSRIISKLNGPIRCYESILSVTRSTSLSSFWLNRVKYRICIKSEFVGMVNAKVHSAFCRETLVAIPTFSLCAFYTIAPAHSQYMPNLWRVAVLIIPNPETIRFEKYSNWPQCLLHTYFVVHFSLYERTKSRACAFVFIQYIATLILISAMICNSGGLRMCVSVCAVIWLKSCNSNWTVPSEWWIGSATEKSIRNELDGWHKEWNCFCRQKNSNNEITNVDSESISSETCSRFKKKNYNFQITFTWKCSAICHK